MLTHSFINWLAIRATILMFISIAPISILWTALRPFLPLPWAATSRIVNILSIYPFFETIFCLFVYFPLRNSCQKKAIHAPLQPAETREELVERCAKTIDDPEAYLRRWFKDAPLAEIKRDNVAEFMSWAFFNGAVEDDDPDLMACVDMIERVLERPLEEGRGTAKALRLTLDPVVCWHRPLFWYGIVSAVDTIACARLRYSGFRLFRPRSSILPRKFPFRPQTLISRQRSPTKHLSYWCRPHTSKTERPLLFIHGIGIGLDTYVTMFNDVAHSIGIIAVEILPISFRITDPMLRSEVFCEEIRAILFRHGLDKVTLVGHSYGTVLATNLLKHRKVSNYIDSVVLIDPVSILLHLPDVAYNFTYRKPRFANEHQLHYYASTDMGVAHTLGRGFFWSENILWKEDLAGRQLLVSLAARDLIVPVKAVAKYLTGEEAEWKFEDYKSSGSKKRQGRHVWATGPEMGHGVAAGAMKILWHEELDHASLFDTPVARKRLVDDIMAQAKIP